MFLLRIKLLLRCSFFSGQMLKNFPSLCEWDKCVKNDAKMYVLCVFRVNFTQNDTQNVHFYVFWPKMSAFIVKTAQKYPLKTHHNAYFGATFNENPFKMTHKSTFMCILSEKQTKWHILCVFWLKRCVFTWNWWNFNTFDTKCGKSELRYR